MSPLKQSFLWLVEAEVRVSKHERMQCEEIFLLALKDCCHVVRELVKRNTSGLWE